MNLVLLRPNVTMEQALEVARGGGDPAQAIERDFGLLVAPPGDASPDTIAVVLLSGRTYAIACFLRDAPGSPEHVMLGMTEGFHVR